MNRFYQFGFFILLAVVLLANGTLPSIIEVKPATPKSTVSFMAYSVDTSDKILQYVKQGYIVKTISGASDGSSGPTRQVVIMEKY